jgi:hypothetical protein
MVLDRVFESLGGMDVHLLCIVQITVSAASWSLVWRRSTGCVYLIVCDIDTAHMRRIGPNLRYSAREKTVSNVPGRIWKEAVTELDSSGSGYDTVNTAMDPRILSNLGIPLWTEIVLLFKKSPCHVKLGIRDSLIPVSGKAVRCTSHKGQVLSRTPQCKWRLRVSTVIILSTARKMWSQQPGELPAVIPSYLVASAGCRLTF